MKHFPSAVLATVLAVSLGACTTVADTTDDGYFYYRYNPDKTVTLLKGDTELFTMLGAQVQSFDAQVSMLFGFFDFEKQSQQDIPLGFETQANGAIVLVQSGQTMGTVTIKETKARNLSVTITLAQAAADAVKLNFFCNSDDRFWGFGEQYNRVEFRGSRVPVWASEQGVGREAEPSLPFIGNLTDTYFPQPSFIDPVNHKGFIGHNTQYQVFDLCAENQYVWSLEVWDTAQVSFTVLAGDSPADVVSRLTDELGKPTTPPPDWALEGVWLAAQGGREAVIQRVATALGAGIPLRAVWVQDWVGLRDFGGAQYGVVYHWIADDTLYPDLPGMIADLSVQGVRFLGYFNPFVLPEREHYDTMADQGFLVKDDEGEPYLFTVSTFKAGLLDVTSPAAVAYFQGYARTALDMGMKGFMADFGEWLPYDAVLSDGQATAIHNRYPTLWHQAGRAVLEEAYPDGDFVLLTRSGFTGEQAVAQVVWAGDQEADWTDTDGLPTVVTAGLSMGLAGIPFFTHDIAGFSGGPSDQELFMRWTELGAFSPVMRTHDGLRKTENHRFDSDAETLIHFTRMARMHQALLPYLKSLADIAVDVGLPLVRRTVLVDPDWAGSLQAHRQWFLGGNLLFAPVLTQGASQVEVLLPYGSWEHVCSGTLYDGRQTVTVDAPLGRPAVFIRLGCLPDTTASLRALCAGEK